MSKTEEAVLEGRFVGLSREELHALLRLMLLSRRFEEKTAEAYQMGRIGGFCHLYIGQEAVAAGAISALRDDDYVITAYRDHAQALVRGIPARAVMAELYGRIDGSSRGAGGSMHMFDRSVNFLGGHGIVGTHLPIATGVGYAIRYRETDQVCLCFFGDSVVNGGPFHEAFNMTAKWELPVVYIVENNSFGMGTDIERVAAIEELFTRACAVPSVEQIQDIVEMVLMKQGYHEVAKSYILYREKHKGIREAKRIGLNLERLVKDYLSNADWKIRENSNEGVMSFAGLNARVSGEVLSNFALNQIYTDRAKKAHEEGEFHIHDLSYPIVGYCAGWSLENLIRKGFGHV
ncbi:MAG: anaerobic ribonucleoside-triphosphate reductase, partial [Gemmatimonadota bacterium]